MHPVSRLLLRNAHRFGAGDATLCINPPGDVPWRNLLTGTARIRLFTQSYADWRRHERAGATAAFGTFPEPGGPLPGNLVVVAPREKDRLRMWLHWCAEVLQEGGTLWLAGENRAGIKSAGKPLTEFFAEVAKLDSARHCTLFQARRATGGRAFAAADYFSTWAAEIGPERLELCSCPGVFSHGRLDRGTRLLLEALEPGEWRGRVLDFGCGAGAIGVYLKSRNPALALTMLDSDALALEATRRSLEHNRIEAELIASDGFSEVAGRWDLVVTNPPFHRGPRAEPGLSPRLLGEARNFLAPRGQLILVANRHLPYRRWLDEAFGAHRVLRDDSQFQVLNAVQS